MSQSNAGVWESTGFHLDGDLRCMFAKVGTNPFQAVGFNDGERHVGTEGSKTLWIRPWGMALVMPWAPPFEVTKEELRELADQRIEEHLTDVEREKIDEVLGWLDEDLQQFHRLEGGQGPERQEMEDKIRETVKFARVRLPRLDRECDRIYRENPECGENFENTEASQLLVTVQEYLRMLLDNDQVRREVQATVLSVGDSDSERVRLINTLMDGISSLLPAEGDELSAVDGQALDRRLDEAAQTVPEVKALLLELQQQDQELTVLDAAKQVLILLQQQLDQVTDQDQSGSDE
jgi:hypothetical protein